MKKILTIALVAVLAATSVFAGVSFSGEVKTGYALTWDKDGNFEALSYGQDGDKTEMTKLNLKASDDNGLWNATFSGAIKTDSSGAVDAALTVDAGKILAAALNKDLPVSAKLSLLGGDRATALRAYSNKSGNNNDRVRTTNTGWKTNVVVAYEKLVQVQFAISPKVTVKDSSSTSSTDKNAIVTSALFVPVDGVKASVGYGYNAEKRLEHTIFGAANVDVAKLADLDFTIGVAASDIFEVESEKNKNTLAAEVYATVKEISFSAEYVLKTEKDADAKNGFHLGADFSALVENSTLDVYFGTSDVANFKDYWYVGGDLGYNLSGVGFNLGVEYNKGGSYNFNSDDRFLVVPSITVAF